MALSVLQPSNVTVMIKPVGALCNLNCTYCYYLPTQAIFQQEHRMSLRTLEDVFASLLPRFADRVTVAWQGGEPTLAGLPFFEKAMQFQRKYARPNQHVDNALQTNGTLLSDPWCRFLKDHNFLVGLSVDGPRDFHDHYRLNRQGEASSAQVFKGLRALQRHQVEFNLLCVLNDRNVHEPDRVLDYLLNLGTRFLQFIPAVEWEPSDAGNGRRQLAPFSPDPAAYGKFLCRVFDRWFEQYSHRLSIRFFDAVLNRLVLGQTSFCMLDKACHTQMTVEHDGSIFACDHFVERRWQIGQIGDPQWHNDLPMTGSGYVSPTLEGVRLDGGHQEAPLPTAEPEADRDWFGRIDTDRMATFAQRKRNLPERCEACKWRPFCFGGCPKHRAGGGDAAEPTVLCEAYRQFFDHAMPRLEWIASYLRYNQRPPLPAGRAGAR